MQKIRGSNVRNKRVFLLLVLTVFLLLFLSSVLLVFRNNRQMEVITRATVSPEMATGSQRMTFLHNGKFFLMLAERLQYYSHNPKMIENLYQVALRKSPAHYEAFFSYAYYLASRNCCPEKVVRLLQETVDRSPMNQKMYRVAATYFLTTRRLDQAIPYFRKALELDPSAAQELYRMLDQNGATVEFLIQITPEIPDCLIQLTEYLNKQGKATGMQLTTCFGKLLHSNLTSGQKLSVAKLALTLNLLETAKKYAEAAATSEKSQIEAWKLLTDLAWQKGDEREFERVTALVEKGLLDRGSLEEAAAFALSMAARIANKNRPQGKQKMLEVLNRYPRYAPAFFAMAGLSSDDSPEVVLFYLKKAAELDPDNISYRLHLAETCIQFERLDEAERLFSELLTIPENQIHGYLGLARCKSKRGQYFSAIQILKEGSLRVTDPAPLYDTMADLYISQGNYPEAVAVLSQYQKLRPQDPKGYLRAGKALQLADDPIRAREQYLRVLDLDPGNAIAQKALEELETAQISQ